MPGTRTLRVATILAGALGAGPLAADTFAPVTDQSEFVALVEGRELRLGALGIALRVLPDGQIEGRAAGWPVNGSWTWQEGYFCREMDWSGTPIPFNCQLVEAQGDSQLRFTVDRGEGDAASFNLR